MKAFEQRRRMAGQQGFTLIELLIVIAILGILAAVVVFAVGNVTDNAEEKACEIEARTVKTAAEAFKADNNGEYPSAEASLTGEWLEDSISDALTITWNGLSAAPTITTSVAGCDI